MTLLRRSLLAGACLALLQGLSAPAEACSCTPTPTPAPGVPTLPKPCIDLRQAQEVYVGRVLSVEPGPTQWTVTARLLVGETFKGVPEPEETVFTGVNSGVCGIPFAAAQEYLIYARSQSVGICDGTKAARFAEYDLTLLRSGACAATPTPSPTPTPTPTPTPPVFSGHYKLLARHSGKAVVVQSASTRNGADVIQWTYGGAATNDEWRITSVAGGYYRLTARHSGKAMVVRDASTLDGGDVIQWTYGGTATNDEWAIEAASDGYYRLVNRHSGKVAEVRGAGTANGADVVQRTWTGEPHQQFAISAIP